MDFSTLKQLWARVRACAGIFAHSAITDLEAEAVKLYQQLEARLAVLEKAAGVTAPASSTEKPAA